MKSSTRRSSNDLLKLAETEGLPKETAALLKILAMRQQEVDRGQLTPLAEVVKRLRNRATRKST